MNFDRATLVARAHPHRKILPPSLNASYTIILCGIFFSLSFAFSFWVEASTTADVLAFVYTDLHPSIQNALDVFVHGGLLFR